VKVGVANPLFVPLTTGLPFYAWDRVLSMWLRTIKEEIKEELGRWTLLQAEMEEEEETEAQEDEDLESPWDEEEAYGTGMFVNS
jgi:hypothetical protein